MEAPRLDVQSDFPCAFQCTSGELLFGQMHCIVEGMNSSLHDGMNGPTLRQQGGTILQNDFQYRAAARAGRWEVSRVFIGQQDESTNDNSYTRNRRMIGYVLHHVDVSPIEYIRRASKVGISNGNKHSDKGIVYIGRYDWSWHHGKRSNINVALGPGHPYTVPQIDNLMAGRLIVIDSSRVQTFINTARNFYLYTECYSLTAMPNEVPYGVHLDSAGNVPDYELGWLGFSGEKHGQFPESDELVAIIYDPAYTGLSDLEPTDAIMVENIVARAGDEVVGDEEDDDDEDYVPESDSDDESATEDSESGGRSSDDMPDEDEVTSLALPDSIPPPSISDVRHRSGHIVTIAGSTLGLVTSVLFGDELASFEIKSNSLIEAHAPAAGAGLVGVRVTGPGGTSDVFEHTYAIIATISSLTPDRGPHWGGNVVVILGYHLERTTNVMFGDLPVVAFEIISDTQINATAPAGFPVARYLEVTLSTPLEVGKGHEYKYLYQCEPPPADFNYDAAITTWLGAINRDPKAWDSRWELAEVYKRKGDYVALINLWKEAVKLEPNSTIALDNLAQAYMLNGNFEVAVTTWETAIREGADEKHILLGLADAYDKTSNKEASINMKNEVVRIWPTDEWH